MFSGMDLPSASNAAAVATAAAAAAATYQDLLIPRHETGAADFASSSYTGRGCVVGIFDTGIDPATHRFLSDGVTPQLLDTVDCTGSGDVDVSYQVDLLVSTSASSASSNDCRTVKGLSGRTL